MKTKGKTKGKYAVKYCIFCEWRRKVIEHAGIFSHISRSVSLNRSEFFNATVVDKEALQQPSLTLPTLL